MSFNIVFLGSPTETLPIVEKLICLHKEKKINFVGIVSQPARPAGRKQILTDPPVAQFAKEKNILCLQPPSAKDTIFLDQFASLKPDIAITAAYGQILNDKFLSIPNRATINVHPSLLPKYRGATPIQSSLLNGDDETGVCILFTVKKLDAGNIIISKKIPIRSDHTSGSLLKEAFSLSCEMLEETFQLLNNQNFFGTPQEEDLVTHCTKFSKEDGKINWEHESVSHLYKKWQAFSPWPGVFTNLNGKRVLFKRFRSFKITEFDPAKETLLPGSFESKTTEDCLKIIGKDGVLLVERLLVEGNKEQSAAEFLNSIKSIKLTEYKFG